MSGTLNVCFNGVSSEALMLASRQYCCVSNGSACNSRSYSPSFVLTAMGIPVEKIENSIRISWGSSSDPDKVEDDFENLVQVAKMLAF